MIDAINQYPIQSGALFISSIFSLRIVLGLWMLGPHKNVRIIKRLFWSVVALVPFIGPMFYIAFYRLPKSHSYGGASVNSDAFYGGGGMGF